MRAISVHELKDVLDGGEAVVVIDVREPDEFAQGHVPGARLAPLQTVPTLVGQLPADQPVYVVCAVGARSAQAAGYLAQHGVDAVNVDGGTRDWLMAGYPVEA